MGLLFIGPANGKWKGGVSKTERGYLRIRHGGHRNKYVHRRRLEVMLENPLCADYVFPNKGRIPAHMVVEHVDHKRDHNCDGNLMLLQKCIHDKLSGDTAAYYLKHLKDSEVPF